MLLNSRFRQWGAAWIGLFIVGVVLCVRSWQLHASAREDLEAWQRRAAGVRKIDTDNARLQTEIAALRERRLKYGDLNSEQIGFQLLATVSQSTANSNGGNQVQKLQFKQTLVPEVVTSSAGPATTAEPVKGKKTPPKMKTVRTLSLSGVAQNNLMVAQFVSCLRDSGAFESVDLKSSLGNKDSGARVYQVECTF